MKKIEPPFDCYIVKAGKIKRYDYIWNMETKKWDVVFGFIEVIIDQEITDKDIVARNNFYKE